MTDADIRERGVFELFWKHAVVLHALKSLLKKGGQFTLESRNVIECIKEVNDEWGHHFFALELLLPKIKSPRAAKFMCHAGDDNFRFNVQQEDHRRINARVESVGHILAFSSLLLVVFFFGWKAFVLRHTSTYAKKTVMLVLISDLEPRGLRPPSRQPHA